MADDTAGDDPVAGLELNDLLARAEADLLGGERRYTRVEMAERSGIDPAELRALWRSLGFATVEDDERMFTDADLAALDNVRRLDEVAGIDEDVMRAMTRIIGQTFARLASWQGQLVLEILGKNPELLQDGSGDRALAMLDDLTPVVGGLHEYVWRRQLVAYFSRIASNAAQIDGEATMAVGFADMAAFTSFTRRSSEAELRTVLETFESLAADVVGQHRGQIVKTIGDEVLFVADRPRDGAEIALALIEAAEDSEELPSLRVGLASGPVVSRLGDVYGQTVNIASRLTSIARPASILVDEHMSEAIGDSDDYALKSLRPASVRGYHHLRSWRLRRASS